MKRTAAERKADDRDSVQSNINLLGAHEAMRWARKELSARRVPEPPRRRILVLTIRAASRILSQDVRIANRIAAAHTTGLRVLGVKVALMLALAASAEAQTSIVYTNIIDGKAYRDSIVRVERPAQPAIPVPSSIVTTEVLPRNYHAPLGATSYIPPSSTNFGWGETRVSRPEPTPQPWFVNGINLGPSPSGSWTSTVIGRPIVDVNVIGTPRRPQ
jgi:hypothetical protein